MVLWHMQTTRKSMGCLMSLKSICGLCEKAVSQMMSLKHTFFHHMLKCNPNETICMKIKKLNISMTQFHSAIAIIMAPKHESFTTPPNLPPLYKHPPPPPSHYMFVSGDYTYPNSAYLQSRPWKRTEKSTFLNIVKRSCKQRLMGLPRKTSLP